MNYRAILRRRRFGGWGCLLTQGIAIPTLILVDAQVGLHELASANFLGHAKLQNEEVLYLHQGLALGPFAREV